MIRRRNLHLIVAPLAALALAGCQDDVTPTAVVPRNPGEVSRPSNTIFTSPDVTYPILHGTLRIYDTKIESVSSGSIQGVFASATAGSTIRFTGKWQIGPITNVDECQFCSYSAYIAWGSSLFDFGALPLNQGLVTLTSPELNPSPGTSGTFDWTTKVPHRRGEYIIGGGWGLGPFDERAGAVGAGTTTGGTSTNRYSFTVLVLGPTITPVVSGTMGANGWYTGDVNVTWAIEDEDPQHPGLEKSGCDPVTITTDVAGMTLTCSVNTNIGPAVRSVTINRDASKPVIAFSALAPAVNGAGWNKTDVTATWTCSDATSGVADASVSKTISAEGADQSATGTCVDKAGNTASDTRSGINIDKTAPTLAPSVSPNPVAWKGVASASPNASDALSGVASASCGAVVTNLAGNFSVQCTATDKAGNTATSSAAYTVNGYAFTGFFSPVSNAPTLNSTTAGSAIPVKFSLGGDQGLAVFAAGYPTSQPITCSGTSSVTAIEETAATSGGSSLTYDAGTGIYTYAWKTAKSWAGTCRNLIVKLADGTEHTALFQFQR